MRRLIENTMRKQRAVVMDLVGAMGVGQPGIVNNNRSQPTTNNRGYDGRKGGIDSTMRATRKAKRELKFNGAGHVSPYLTSVASVQGETHNVHQD